MKVHFVHESESGIRGSQITVCICVCARVFLRAQQMSAEPGSPSLISAEKSICLTDTQAASQCISDLALLLHLNKNYISHQPRLLPGHTEEADTSLLKRPLSQETL